jgi:bifunctional non-homologous end joining protein LigD
VKLSVISRRRPIVHAIARSGPPRRTGTAEAPRPAALYNETVSEWRGNPADVRPMLATLADPPVTGRGLVYEPKYDGIRALVDLRPPAGRRPASVAIYSRNGREKHVQFPAIVAALTKLAPTIPHPLLLDGEIVAIAPDGRPLGFQHVQGRIHLTSPADIARAEQVQPAAIILFDLLRDGDEDLRGRPLAERRLRLQDRIRPTRTLRRFVRLSDIAADDGRELLARARAEGWEGLIVKDGHSVYESGRRTPAWRKLKLLQEQEFVVGGWTEPRQSRPHFGALLVGYYDDEGALRWAGSVGTGFDQRELERLAHQLDALATPRSPFADTFRTMEPAHWVRPRMVVQVKFAEWTSDGLLRQPVYLGVRDDKSPADVRRERPAGTTAPKLPSGGRYRRNRRATPGGTVAARTPATPHVTARRPGTRAASKTKTARRTNTAAADGQAPKRPAAPAKGAAKRPRTRRPAAAVLAPADRDRLIDALETIERTRKDGDLALPNGDTLRVTNLAKPYWPALGLTKGDLLRYYVQVAPFILPAVADRPLVMRRFPNGVDGPAFYQQRHPEAVPPGVRREVLPADVDPIDESGPRDRLIGGSLTTLLYMAQLGAISQDPWFSRVSSPLDEDSAALDLDPTDGTGFDRVLEVARWIKIELDRYGIPAWPKTSGATGLHIHIPLPPGTSYETGQLLCRFIASLVATAHPKVATIERTVRKRPRGTVYVDFLQNILGKTLATAYSARASDYAGVSTPLTWDEVARGVDPHDFTIRTAPARFAKVGDLWEGLRTSRPVDLRAVLRRASG